MVSMLYSSGTDVSFLAATQTPSSESAFMIFANNHGREVWLGSVQEDSGDRVNSLDVYIGRIRGQDLYSLLQRG